MAQVIPPRTLNTTGIGDPSADSLFASQMATGMDTSPYQKFGLALMDMLKKYQGLGTSKFQTAGINAQQEQVNRIMAPATPGYSPTAQSTMTSASANAMNPSITGAANLGKSFSEQIQGLGDAISQARAIGSLMQQEESDQRKDAIDMITKFPTAVKALDDKTKNALAKRAGVPVDFINALPDSTSTRTQVVSVGGRELLVDLNTGTTIKDLGVTTSTMAEAKPPTADQLKVGGFGQRLTQSGKIMDDLESQIKLMGTVDRLRMNQGGTLGYILKTDTMKKVDQAERNFINAVLRRESGAVISPSEFAEGRMQYFPQPGDSNDVLSQKRNNRKLVEQNYILESSGGYVPSGKIKLKNPTTGEIKEFASLSSSYLLEALKQGFILQ